jgi:glycosyltransferase involved in cell wall biosynthesis
MMPWVIAAGDFTPLGGMDRANYALAKYLSSRGRDVHLVAHRVSPDLAAASGVTVHRASRPFGAHLVGAPLLSRAASAAASRIGGPARLLANGGNTRWHAPTWIHYLHAAYEPQVAAGWGARAVASTRHRHYLAREAASLAHAPAIICNSARTAADVLRHYDVAVDRVTTVYYGTDPEQFGAVSEAERRDARQALGFDAERPVALFIGALGDRRKGFDALFEAWERLRARPDTADWDVRLVVVGTGAEAAAWQRRAVSAGLGSCMTFLNFRSDVARILAAADVLVHPSRYEAYGLGVHEALCRGLPVIVTESAGVAERLPDGFQPLTLRDPVAVDDLVLRLLTWRRDIGCWRSRAALAGEALRQRTWDHMAAEIATIVERA